MLPISEFGLIEITRQRSRGNLERVLTRACPGCSGSGRVKTDLTGGARSAAALLLKPPVLYGGREAFACAFAPVWRSRLAEETRLWSPTPRSASGSASSCIPDESVGAPGFEILRG